MVPCFGEKISDLGLAAALQLTTTVLYYTISYYNYYTIRYYTIVLTTTEPPKLYEARLTVLRGTCLPSPHRVLEFLAFEAFGG